MKFREILTVIAACLLLFAHRADAQAAVNLAYDGDGNLVAKTVNGVTTQYLVDDMNPTGLPQVIEETVNGVVQRRYTYGKQRISETQLINGIWITSYYVYDGQGNVRQLTNAAGVVTDTYDYDAFGNFVSHTGTTPNVYLYRGERYDPDLGLYYMRARWYNPLTGRFLSRDPEEGKAPDPKTLHKYLYASGDPVNRVDPSGQGDLIEDVNIQNLTSNEAKAASRLKIPIDDLKDAIHALKRDCGGQFEGNPDVLLDMTNGNVYLPQSYDFLANIFDYIAECGE